MRNEELLIKTAAKLVNENNNIYKIAASGRAYIIYATDAHGYRDTFITVNNTRSAKEWQDKFISEKFTNVVVQPFDSPGDLDFSEVNPALYKHSSERPKIEYTLSPTRDNPFQGRQTIAPTDFRRSPTTVDSTNELQQFLGKQFENNDELKIRCGWFGGSITDWLNKVSGESDTIKNILELEFPDMYNNLLLRHLYDKGIDHENYVPSKRDIKYFGINMHQLRDFLFTPNIDFQSVPEKRVEEQLKEIISAAQQIKKYRQYGKNEMDNYYQSLESERMRNQDDTRQMLRYFLKSMV